MTAAPHGNIPELFLQRWVCDLLTSLRHPVRLIGSHPSELTRQLSHPGSGSDVEGFSSGLPHHGLALRAMKNTMMLYKYYSLLSLLYLW